MKFAQLVHVANVHLLATNFAIEIQQVDCAAHSILAVFVRDDRAILEQPFDKMRYSSDEFEYLVDSNPV